jgi:hypothetical protein
MFMSGVLFMLGVVVVGVALRMIGGLIDVLGAYTPPRPTAGPTEPISTLLLLGGWAIALIIAINDPSARNAAFVVSAVAMYVWAAWQSYYEHRAKSRSGPAMSQPLARKAASAAPAQR